MHSRDYTAKQDNFYGEEGTVLEGDVFSFNFNSDMSGEVLISSHRRTNYAGNPPREVQSIVIPGDMLLQLVGEYINSEAISKLQGFDGRETLGFFIGDKV